MFQQRSARQVNRHGCICAADSLSVGSDHVLSQRADPEQVGTVQTQTSSQTWQLAEASGRKE